MKTPNFLPHTLLLLLLVSATPAHAEGETCPEYYTTLANWGNDFLVTRFDPKKPKPNGPIEKMRDWARKSIVRLRGRRYPILAMEDATGLKANLLAKHALKDTANLEGAPFDLAALKKEVLELLADVEAYPAARKAYIDDTATFAAQAEAMRDMDAAADAAGHNFKGLLPVATVQPDGKVLMEMKPQRWPTYTAFRQDLVTAEKELAIRINDTTVALVTKSEDFVLDQAMDLKKLETYRSELDYLTDKIGRRGARPEIDPELKPLYDRINGIFENGGSKFRADLSPPAWAWDKLKWEQLRAELKTIYQKDPLKITDNETAKKVLAYLSGLKPEELRNLGMDKLAAAITIGKKSIYVRTLILPFLATGGVGTMGKVGWDFVTSVISEAAKKEACAASRSDDQFRDCVYENLQSQFTVDSIKAALFAEDPFLDKEGKIRNPKVQNAVGDMIARRKAYQAEEKAKAENKEAYNKEVKAVQAKEDPFSDAYRDNLIMQPKKEQFLLGLVAPQNGTVNFLEANHPSQFKKNRDLVFHVLQEDDDEKQENLLKSLRQSGACELSETLSDLIADRRDFANGEFTPGQSQKRRSRRRSSCTDVGSNVNMGISNTVNTSRPAASSDAERRDTN
ncbi:MAG: hypothetical protein AB7K68_12700 [Bacteriovoracia bacterium]